MDNPMYNYFYYGTPITADQFRSNVPTMWKFDVVDGCYSWGGYSAVKRD
jgi:hypothetical protein